MWFLLVFEPRKKKWASEEEKKGGFQAEYERRIAECEGTNYRLCCNKNPKKSGAFDVTHFPFCCCLFFSARCSSTATKTITSSWAIRTERKVHNHTRGPRRHTVGWDSERVTQVNPGSEQGRSRKYSTIVVLSEILPKQCGRLGCVRNWKV